MIRLLIIFLVALILTIVPLPEILIQFKPPWVLLVILYLQFYLPKYFKISLVFLLGLMLDTLLSTAIGEHALCLCFVTWLASSQTRRFALFPIAQQMIFIGLFAVTYQLTLVLIDAFFGHKAKFITIPIMGMISVLVWPWLRLLGEELLLNRTHARATRR